MHRKESSVLIVDDEPSVCDLLHSELVERGFFCATAFDGDNALAKLRKQHFDVMLLDIKLPGMSGIALLRKLEQVYRRPRIIMITAINDVDTAVETMKLGASDYIVKPFDLDRVEASIRESATAKRQGKQRGNNTGQPKDKTKDSKVTKGFSEINAIAFGVEARYNSIIGFSKMVTEEAANVAWQLSVPEQRVQRWICIRTKLDSEQAKMLESISAKLEKSLLGQLLFGLLPSYPRIEKSDKN